ncbi:MAG: hypothetical protein WBR15_03660 [Gammaproteobacteria bacterium]
MIRGVIASMLFLWFMTAVAADSGPHLECKIIVPVEYQSKVDDPGFPGTSPYARYSAAYKAFWWNCVAVKAANISARCPFLANGWASESYGAAYGELSAENGINVLIKKYGVQATQAYLQKLASPPSKIKAKLGGWFDGKPTIEPEPQRNKNS